MKLSIQKYTHAAPFIRPVVIARTEIPDNMIDLVPALQMIVEIISQESDSPTLTLHIEEEKSE